MPILEAQQAPSEELYIKNREAILARLAAGAHEGNHGSRCMLGLELERFVYDPLTNMTIPYEGTGGTPGVLDLLEHMEQFWAENERVVVDDHLAGFAGFYTVGEEQVGASISIEPAAQLEISVGPSTSVSALYGAVEQFDRQVELAIRELGVDWQLLAQGSNPTVSSPDDLALIPKERYRLMDAYLSKTGKYARDMMRGSCATQVSIDYGSEADMAACMRLTLALGPLLAFGCDNSVRWRGVTQEANLRMARSQVWKNMDPARCGTPPHTFDDSFGYTAYVDWMEGVNPILFTDRNGVTWDTGDATIGDILHTRDLSESEIAHLFTMMFPNARLKGYIEIREADSLPPRMAAGFTALIKGIFGNEDAFVRANALFEGISAADIDVARTELEEKGWEATTYGRPVGELMDEIVAIAQDGLAGNQDARFLGELCDLWAARMVPRDMASV